MGLGRLEGLKQWCEEALWLQAGLGLGWGPCRKPPGSLCFQNKTLPIEDTTDCLSTMACVCRVMLETPCVSTLQALVWGPSAPSPAQTLSLQGVPQSFHQHRDAAVLHAGDGWGHHPL